jgi:hypothetical protein
VCDATPIPLSYVVELGRRVGVANEQPGPPDDNHGQLSTRGVCSGADVRFRVAPHMYSTVSVFRRPWAGSPHQPLLTDTRHRGRKPPHASLARFLISAPAVHVRPGTPYSASTISMDTVDTRCRTVQSRSIPPTNARATMTNLRRLGRKLVLVIAGRLPRQSSRKTKCGTVERVDHDAGSAGHGSTCPSIVRPY